MNWLIQWLRGLLWHRRYEAYLESASWDDKRRAVLKRDGNRCQGWGCGRRDNLHVHHKTYKRVGRERLDDLTTLCRDCHKRVHGRSGWQRLDRLLTKPWVWPLLVAFTLWVVLRGPTP